jgi:hypothetical protein
MSIKLFCLSAIAFGALTVGLNAQDSESRMPVTLGFKVGVPVTDMFSASNTSVFNSGIPGSNYTSGVPRYTFGVTGEFHLPKQFRLEVDGLYKRAGFANSGAFAGGTDLFYQSTSLNVWEVPVLIKKTVTVGKVRPFVDIGASLRHISTISQYAAIPGVQNIQISENSPALHNRNSYGGVAGLGIAFKKGPVTFSPEVRYTRWANESFQANGLRTNLDQGDVLLGITF